MSRLTLAQQRARYGGRTMAEATALRDDVLARLDPATVAESRAAWRDMAAEVRASARHPEAIRLDLIRLLGEGLTVPEAVAKLEI